MVKVEDVLYVSIFITMTALGTAFFLQEQAEQRNITDLDTSYNDTFNTIDEVSNSTETIREKIETSSLVSVEGIAALFNGAYSILRLTFNIVFLPITLTYSIVTTLDAPWWVGICLASLWIIAIAFAIAYIVFGRSPA